MGPSGGVAGVSKTATAICRTITARTGAAGRSVASLERCGPVTRPLSLTGIGKAPIRRNERAIGTVGRVV